MGILIGDYDELAG